VGAAAALTAALTLGATGVPASGLSDTNASRAFDQVKPAVVRVVAVTTEQVAVHVFEPNQDALGQFAQKDASAIANSGITDSTAIIVKAFQDLATQFRQDPALLLQPGPDVLRTQVSDKTMGSGTIVDPSGTVVTAASLAPSTPAARAGLHDRVITDLDGQIDGYLSFLTPTFFFGPPGSGSAVVPMNVQQDVVNALIDAVKTLSTAQLTYEQESTAITVQVGQAADPSPGDPSTKDLPSSSTSSSSGAQSFVAFHSAAAPSASGAGNYPATVQYRPAPGSPAIAVLKIAGTGFPTAPLGATGPVDGQQLLVAGYAAPGTDPTALVHPVRTAGSVSVTGTEPDSAQIAFSSSQVGGPAVDLTGQIRGVAVMAGAKTAVVGLEPLRAALAQAHLTAGTQAADALWRAAIADTRCCASFKPAPRRTPMPPTCSIWRHSGSPRGRTGHRAPSRSG
jgi:hypothetical protein